MPIQETIKNPESKENIFSIDFLIQEKNRLTDLLERQAKNGITSIKEMESDKLKRELGYINNEIKKIQTIGKEDIEQESEIMPGVRVRLANEKEKENFKNLDKVPEKQKEALKQCSKILNKNCNYPWYLMGSIAFMINVEDSQKIPDDVDIIFHEKDFPKISTIFREKYNFKSGIDSLTKCQYIKGNINGVEIEIYAQSTEKPDGLINPGSKDSKYTVIKNDLEGENVYSIDKDAQIELYTKNLINELRRFNLGFILEQKDEKIVEDKSAKFIQRLANLFELSQYDNKGVLRKIVETYKKNNNDQAEIREFLAIAKKFNESQKNDGQKDLTNIYNHGRLQPALENIKKEIGGEIIKFKDSYQKIKEQVDNIESLNKEEKTKLKQEIKKQTDSLILNEEEKNKSITQRYIELEKNIKFSNKKNLVPYIFIVKFLENFSKQYSEAILELDKKIQI